MNGQKWDISAVKCSGHWFVLDFSSFLFLGYGLRNLFCKYDDVKWWIWLLGFWDFGSWWNMGIFTELYRGWVETLFELSSWIYAQNASQFVSKIRCVRTLFFELSPFFVIDVLSLVDVNWHHKRLSNILDDIILC